MTDKTQENLNWRKKISSALIDEENNLCIISYWDDVRTSMTIEEAKEKHGWPLIVEPFQRWCLFREIETLQQQLDAAKQENERLRQIRYNATEAHLNIQTGLVEQIETLQQRFKQVEEAIQVAYNIAYENFETVNQMDLIRLTLGDTLSIIRGEANKREPIEIAPFNFENRIVECDLPPFEANKEEKQ
jgi:hypothetical protein